MDVPVIKFDDAVKTYGKSDKAAFIVTIFNGADVLTQLKNAGCERVISFVVLYRAFPEMLPLASLAQPAPIVENKKEVRQCFDLWADDESREEYVRLLAWHTSPTYYTSQRLHPARETYFAPDLVHLHDHERFIDCGAYDGDSVREFIKRAGGKVEPIAGTFKKLSAYRDSVPETECKKMDVYEYAVSSSNGILEFSSDEMASSAVYGESTVKVKTAMLVEILKDFHPIFIKMDIEGGEPEALKGAKTILKNDAPLLAICLYHDIRHLWEVALIIHSINPAYKLYLRRYASDCWETMCYAVPPSRA